MPQPISTPTAAGMTAPWVASTVPTVAPFPYWQSGMTAVLEHERHGDRVEDLLLCRRLDRVPRKEDTALSLTVSTNVKLTSSGRSVKGRRREAAIESLPQLAKAATNEELQNAFTSHAKETDRQSARLEKVFRSVGESVRGKESDGLIGIVEEAKRLSTKSRREPFSMPRPLPAAIVSTPSLHTESIWWSPR